MKIAMNFLKLALAVTAPCIIIMLLLVDRAAGKTEAAAAAGMWMFLAGVGLGILLAQFLPFIGAIRMLTEGKCPSCCGELRVCSRSGGDEVLCENHNLGPEYRLVGSQSCDFKVKVLPPDMAASRPSLFFGR
jgi:hypothetical protein